jgi:hypothetical protein
MNKTLLKLQYKRAKRAQRRRKHFLLGGWCLLATVLTIEWSAMYGSSSGWVGLACGFLFLVLICGVSEYDECARALRVTVRLPGSPWG